MTFTIEWEDAALDDLDRRDRRTRERILRAVERFATIGHGDVRRLVNLDAEYRLPVGPWRVLFDRDDAARVLTILHVLPRGGAYE